MTAKQKPDVSSAKETRIATALRENLRKRKAQANARDTNQTLEEKEKDHVRHA